MTQLTVKIRKVRPHATLPTYGTAGAACFDLYAAEDVIIYATMSARVPTGFEIEIPDGYEMQIRPRSGISAKTYLRISNSPGTVDSDFRGEVEILVDNTAPTPPTHHSPYCVRGIDGACVPYRDAEKGTYLIRRGDRIAQACIVPVPRIKFEETDEDLSQTKRGRGAFGSTGVRYEDLHGNTRCNICGNKVEGGYCNC